MTKITLASGAEIDLPQFDEHGVVDLRESSIRIALTRQQYSEIFNYLRSQNLIPKIKALYVEGKVNDDEIVDVLNNDPALRFFSIKNSSVSEKLAPALVRQITTNPNFIHLVFGRALMWEEDAPPAIAEAIQTRARINVLAEKFCSQKCYLDLKVARLNIEDFPEIAEEKVFFHPVFKLIISGNTDALAKVLVCPFIQRQLRTNPTFVVQQYVATNIERALRQHPEVLEQIALAGNATGFLALLRCCNPAALIKASPTTLKYAEALMIEELKHGNADNFEFVGQMLGCNKVIARAKFLLENHKNYTTDALTQDIEDIGCLTYMAEGKLVKVFCSQFDETNPKLELGKNFKFLDSHSSLPDRKVDVGSIREYTLFIKTMLQTPDLIAQLHDLKEPQLAESLTELAQKFSKYYFDNPSRSAQKSKFDERLQMTEKSRGLSQPMAQLVLPPTISAQKSV